MERFTSKIYKIGINPVVDPPDDVLQALFAQAGRSKGPIPVRGVLNGAEFTQTLVKFQGAWRLYINGIMLKDSGLAVGDKADVEIEFDPRPRDAPVPRRFADALTKDMPPSRQKEILRYLGSLKTAESLTKNIDCVLKHLKGDRTDKRYAIMRTKKP